MLTQKVSRLFYRLVLRLIFCRFARHYEEHHTAAEDVYAARIGPLHVEVNECFVLDHADASISLQAKWGRGWPPPASRPASARPRSAGRASSTTAGLCRSLVGGSSL